MTGKMTWKLTGLAVLTAVMLAGCSGTKPPAPVVKPPVDLTPDQKLIQMGFKDTRKNRIHNAQGLDSFFRKIDDRANRQVRVLQIGDSHIRGHVFPGALRQKLASRWGSAAMVDKTINYHTTAMAEETGANGFIFHAKGKNGCTLSYYLNETRMDEIAALKPDLIIVSVGTNESHAKFDPVSYREKLNTFIAGINARLAAEGRETAFLLTTPPCSHIKQTQVSEYVDEEGKTRTQSVKAKVPNPVAADVAGFQAAYGERNGIAVWNLYDTVGGRYSACNNWWNGGFMAKDGVHFTKKAYTLQAELLGQAILDAYDSYRRSLTRR